MEVKIKDLEKSNKQIEVELSKEEFDVFIEKAYQKVSANMEIKGFRKGKVPRDIVEKAMGKEGILVEAGDLAVQESYKKAILENNLEPISPPEVKITKIAIGSSLAYEAKFPVMPEVVLPDYRKIAKNVKRNEVMVKDKEVEGTLKWIQRSRAKFTAKNSAAQKGDFVEIEYSSPDIPEINKDNAKKDAFILGEGHFIPGFEDIISGMNPQEEKNNVQIDIPKDHSFKKIAGKKVGFDIKLKSVQKVDFPEINDEFAKSVGNFENLQALKENIIQGIKHEKDHAEQQKTRNELLDKIAQDSKIEIPGVLVEREQGHMLEHLKKDAPSKLGVSYDEYLKKINKTEEDIKKMLLPQAEKKIRNFLALREIGRKENIEVEENEVQEEVKNILSQYSDPKEAGLDPEQLKDYTREVIKTEKIFQVLENLAK